MRKRFVLWTLFLCLVVFLCGCGKVMDGNSYRKSAETDGISEDQASQVGERPEEKASFVQRKLIRTVSLEIETVNYDDYMAKLRQEIAGSGGYIEKMQEYGVSSHRDLRSCSMTARIPADRLDDFLNKAGDGASIISRSENTKDVTETYTDTKARLAVMRAEEESLTALLKKAEKVEEIIQVRDRLTQVRSDIEAYEAILKSYDSLVSYSTVSISAREVTRESADESVWRRIGNNLSDNFSALGVFFVESFVFVLSALPFLLMLAAVVLIILLFAVFLPRRRKKKAQQKETEK